MWLRGVVPRLGVVYVFAHDSTAPCIMKKAANKQGDQRRYPDLRSLSWMDQNQPC